MTWYVSSNKSNNTYYGLVPNDWGGVSSVDDVTVATLYLAPVDSTGLI